MIHEWLIFNVSLLKHNLFHYSLAQYAAAGLLWHHTLDKLCRGGRGLRSTRVLCYGSKCLLWTHFSPPTFFWPDNKADTCQRAQTGFPWFIVKWLLKDFAEIFRSIDFHLNNFLQNCPPFSYSWKGLLLCPSCHKFIIMSSYLNTIQYSL